MSFLFTYDDMVHGYYEARNNETYFDNKPDVICFMIEQTKKYETASKKQRRNETKNLLKKQGYLGAFVKQNVDKDHIRKLKFMDESATSPDGTILYPMGIYLMIDLENKKRKSNLYFVFPTVKRANAQEIVAGDHYSFMYDKGDVAKPIHLHYTRYIPFPTDVTIGDCLHGPSNYFADNVHLPIEGYDCDRFLQMGFFRNDILDLCRLHKRVETVGGGTKRKISSLSSSRNVSTDISKGLEQVLLRREITRVMAIGIKHHERWHMTVTFEWIEEDSESESSESQMSEDYADDGRHSMLFIMDNATYASFQKELTTRLNTLT